MAGVGRDGCCHGWRKRLNGSWDGKGAWEGDGGHGVEVAGERAGMGRVKEKRGGAAAAAQMGAVAAALKWRKN